jgi:hypothetical protein
MSGDSSVGIATDNGLDDRMVGDVPFMTSTRVLLHVSISVLKQFLLQKPRKVSKQNNSMEQSPF